MLLELGCILGGIPAGYALRHRARVVRGVNAAASSIVYVLLFLLGISLGGNHDLLERLTELGLRGVCIGLLCAAGSALAAYLLSRGPLRMSERP